VFRVYILLAAIILSPPRLKEDKLRVMTFLIGIGILILCIYGLYMGVFIPGSISRKLSKADEIRKKTNSNLLNSNILK